MKLKFTLIALVAMLSGFAVNAANLQQADVLLPVGVSESSFGDNTVVDGTITNVESVAVAKIGETGYATFAEALTAAAAMTGDVTVEIYEKVTLAGPLAGSYSSIKFVGKAENAEIYLDIKGYSEAAGKKVVFEYLKLSKAAAGGYIDNAGFMNLAFGVYGATETTYTNCTFLNGAYASTGNVTFANCTFYRSHDRYGLWAYGNANITVNGCTFADIRGIKMYVESKDQQSAATLTVKNTDFTAADNKPAIVLTYGKSVTLENNTYSSKGVFELDLDGKPNGVAVTSDVAPTCVNDNGACGVLVDGKIYTTVAQAAAVATSGSNVTLLHNSAETVEFPEGVILDKKGFEAAGVTVAQPVVVAKVGDVYYATLSEAFAAVTDDYQTVVICKDVTENLTGAYLRGNITTENGAKVTITLTNSDDWVYCPYTFVLGENITLNVPALFYYAGGTQINGTLIVDEYYQRYAGTRLTINEPGSMTVTSETCIIRYMDGDANAGIYINGDNNDETVGLNLVAAYFYQGMINAKDANIKTSVYCQTNDTDNQGSANLVLDNSKLVVTGYENIAKFTGNSTVTLKNESVIDAYNCGFTYGDKTSFSIDATSKIIGKNGDFVAQLPNAEVVNLGHVTVGPEAEGVYNTDSYYVYDLINGGGLANAVEPFNLQIAMNFKANDSAEQAAANAYGNYTTDFYITMTGINGDSFEADGCYLAGYYPSFNAWVKIPLDGFTVKNGQVYPVITAAGFDFKYTDICGQVKDFICGIYLTPEVLAANPDLKVELSLGLSKDMDAALAANFIKVDSYTYDAEALTPPVAQLPNAEVVNLGHVTVGPEAEGVYNTDSYYVYDLINGGGLANAVEPFNLQIAMNFKANDSAEQAAANAYGNYTTDFYITMTGINGDSFEADGCYLAGYYPSFNAWVKIPLDDFTVENGRVYPVITAAGFDFKYTDICGEVKDFICGIYLTPEVLAANPDLNVELSLGLSKDMDAALAADFVKVDSYEYTAEAFECPLSGEGTEASPFLIKNVNDLVLFRNSVNSGDTKYNAPGVWVALGADIDLDGITWTEGIGDGHNWSFDGNFDGKNYTIKNLTVAPYADDNKYLCGGLFGYIYGGVTIKNLTIENATIEFVGEEGKDYFNVGVLVGFANNNGGKANISNITVKGDIKVNAPNAYGVGAIVGYSYRDMGTITNCTVEANNGSYIKGYSFVGGITGYSYAGATIAGCSVKNIDITATNYSVAGIAGLASANNTVSNSVVENVTVNGEANVGNVIGAIAANGIVVENCTAAEPLVGGNYSDNKAVEARIGNKYYATLDAALAAEGNEVTLLAPITVAADETRVLDLNGKTVSHSMECTASYQMINNKGNLTITGNGKISFTDTSAGDPSFGWGSYTVRNEGTLVVENGTIEHKGAQAGTHCIMAIYQYCGSTTINGGTISTPNYRSVRLWKGDMTINDGTFDGQVWVQSVDDSANLTINGGTFEPNGRDASSVFIGNVTNNGVHHAAAFSVTGGTFNGKIGCNDTETLAGDLIAGGTFSATAKENTNVELLATGYVFESNENGTFGVSENPAYGKVAQIGEAYYATLAEAVTAAQAGETITMIADVELAETVKVLAGKNIILDLNGKTIDGTEKVRIAIMSYGDLTVKDSSAEQNGVVKAGIGTAGNAINICGGNFTLESGNIYSKNNALLIDEEVATVNIIGGKITAEPETRNSAVMYISSTSETIVNITGGELVGYNGILLWNNTELNISGGIINATGSTAIQGNGSKDNTKINITGGVFSGYYAAIYHPQGGELNISGGELTGWTAVVVKGGTVNISGGTLNGIGESDTYRPVSSGYVDTGDALYVEHYDNSNNSENYGTPVVTVTGGTFNSTNAKPIASYVNTNKNIEALDEFVSGGTFNKEIDEELLVEGYMLQSNENGTFGVIENPDYISELTLIDGQFDAYDYGTNKTVGTFTYKRTFSGLNWNAFYVPFEIEMSELIEKYDIAYINDVHSYDNDDNGEIDEMTMEVIKITNENAILVANHPYLIRPKKEDALSFSITLYDVTLFAAKENTLDCTSMYTKFEVTGSYRRRGIDDLEGKLVLSGAGEWITMTVGTMNPCRLILTITSREGSPVKISPAAAKSICIVTRGEIDGTTGIEGVEYESTDAIYDLSGRRVNEITKAGVYVVNGKKVLVK